MTRICLNMIVRNESARLERCLSSVVPYISCYAITDTGSTDQTCVLIADFFNRRDRLRPGFLDKAPFINFEQARNTALDTAKTHDLNFDYLLFIDADMELVVEDAGTFNNLQAPAYMFLQRTNDLSYWNTRLVHRDVAARYVGVTHEYLSVPGGPPERLYGAWFRDHADGANRANKAERDRALLAEDVRGKERSFYYLAQSLKELGQSEEAALAYKMRSTFGWQNEEAWHASLSAARCQSLPSDRVIGLINAFNARPTRAEPLYDLAKHYRERGMNEAALIFAEAGIQIPKPDDILFVEDYPYDWGFSEEASISYYYSSDPRRRAIGHECCEFLALSRDAPQATREQAWRNLFFYTRPLATMAPSLRTQRIDFTPPDGYRPMNPSVCRLGDQMYLNVRAVDYLIGQDGRYVTPPDGNFVGRTRNFLFDLGADLRIGHPVELKLPANVPAAFSACLGFEDLRLFTTGPHLWASATSRQHNPEGWCEIVVAEINPCYRSLGSWHPILPEGPKRAEKNWMPIIGDEPRWIYSCDPVRVIGDDGKTLCERPSPVASAEWGGSSQAIPFDGGYLVLIHERQAYPDPMRGQRNYQRRFVWFDSDFNIRRISRRFFFGDGEGEFVCGMCWHPDGKRLVISYGVLDREAWLATVDADEVRAMLREVGGPGPISSPRPDEHFIGPEPTLPPHALQSDGSVLSDMLLREVDGGTADRGDRAGGGDSGDRVREPAATVMHARTPAELINWDTLIEDHNKRYPNIINALHESEKRDEWLDRNTNAVLRTEADLEYAIDAMKANGWLVHPDRTKNWDCYIALKHALANTTPDDRILDAGADRVSTFLPTLSQLGYRKLTGINKIFAGSDSLLYQYGDIEATPFDDNKFSFIACLSTIEHGVNVQKFLSEAARILKPRGYLFISTDFWNEPIDTKIDGWRIFTREDIRGIYNAAYRVGFTYPAYDLSWNMSAEERVCHHGGCDYTFVNLLFQKAA